MKHAAIILFLVFSQLYAGAQTNIAIQAGPLFSKARYGGDWKNKFTINANTGWFVRSAVEIPLSKKVFFSGAIELANKKFTYKIPPPTLFSFQRTEECTYVNIKPLIQLLIIKLKEINVSAGGGLFAGFNLGGTYTETADSLMGMPANVSGKLKIGNTSGNSYKKTDAGFSLQLTGRYKNFTLPLMADFSLINNIPGAGSAKRKWQSYFIGLGYSFRLK